MKDQILKLIRAIPEGPIKKGLRETVLNNRNGIPRELLINQGDTVVQVGMWRPESAHRLSNSVGDKGKILFIDICSKAIENVKTTLSDKGFENATFINKGAWSTKTELPVHDSERPEIARIENGQLHPGSLESENQEIATLQVDTIENMCSESSISSIDYVEITVNGAELEALKGMGKFLKSTKRIWVAGLTRCPETNEPMNVKVSEFLEENGYQVKISQTSKAENISWGEHDGHVYAWK